MVGVCGTTGVRGWNVICVGAGVCVCVCKVPPMALKLAVNVKMTLVTVCWGGAHLSSVTRSFSFW